VPAEIDSGYCEAHSFIAKSMPWLDSSSFDGASGILIATCFNALFCSGDPDSMKPPTTCTQHQQLSTCRSAQGPALLFRC